MKNNLFITLIGLLNFSYICTANVQFKHFKKFCDDVLLSKDFETAYDLIKDDNYRKQREQYRKGICNDHPMDSFVQKMIRYNIDLKTFMMLVFYVLQTKLDISYQDEFGLSDTIRIKARFASDQKAINLRKIAQSQPKQIIIDESATNYISQELYDSIIEIYTTMNMCGKLIIYVDIDPSHRISSNCPEDRAIQELFLSEEFFELDSDIQKGILLHEFFHIISYHYLGEYFWHDLGISFEQIKSSESRKLNEQLCEYSADQAPATLNLEYAELIKQSLEYIDEESPCKDQFKNRPSYTDRYNAVKTIAQLHKTFERLERGITHPR